MARNEPNNPRTDPRVEPGLLKRVNARHVLNALLQLGPCTRTALGEFTGISAPTMSKLMNHLMNRRLVEEVSKPLLTAGRPSKIFRLAHEKARVMGLVIDIEEIKVFSSGLDGCIQDELVRKFPTPNSYRTLVSKAVKEVRRLVKNIASPHLGLGVSAPGLINARKGRIMLSPNLRFLDGRRVGSDLQGRLEMETVLCQEEQALCLAEQIFGAARGLHDFVLIDISAGLGMGVMSGGRFVKGREGYGGELGHITMDPKGEQCGCGNRGCLETLVTDRVFTRMVEAKAKRTLTVDEAIDLVMNKKIRLQRELRRMIGFLAQGLGTVINLFNPEGVFIYGRLFDVEEGLFDDLLSQVENHTLKPSFDACTIVRSQGSKKLGAAAAIISRLFQAAGPSIQSS